MKATRHLFFSPHACTGCRLCELICSQVNQGQFNPDEAIIHILTHPDLGSQLVSIRPEACVCRDGAEACIAFCNVKAIRFVDEDDVARWLKDREWLAAPVFE